jgi:isocitrate dehydrogenase
MPATARGGIQLPVTISSSAVSFSTSATRSFNIARAVNPRAGRVTLPTGQSSLIPPPASSSPPAPFTRFQIRTMASERTKIRVKNPVVELDGDEVC